MKKNKKIIELIYRFKKFCIDIHFIVINNLTQGYPEFYGAMNKSYKLFMYSFILLILLGIIVNYDFIDSSTLISKVLFYIILILVVLMSIGLFSVNKINNTAKKKAKKEQEFLEKEEFLNR